MSDRPPGNQCVTCGRIDCYIGFDGVNIHIPTRSLHQPPATPGRFVGLELTPEQVDASRE